MVLEKTLESPLDCKEIQPIHPKGGQSWVFIGRTDAKAETPVFLDFPCGSAGKESACNAGDLGLIPGLGRFPGEVHGQRSLAGNSPWDYKKLDMTD